MISWYGLVLISSVLMGLATIIEKTSLKVEHATAFSSALNPIVAILSLVFIPWASFQITFVQLLILIFLSVINAYSFLLAARVFKHGELSIASPTFSTLPTLFTVLLGLLFLGELLTLFQYFMILGIVFTTYFLLFRKPKTRQRPSFDDNKYKHMLVFYAFVSAVGNIIGKYLLVSMNPYTFLILSGIFMSIVFALLISIRYGGIAEIVESIKKYKVPLAANAVLTLGYRVTFFVALATAPISLAQPLRNTLYVIITVAFAGMFFKEKDIPKRLLLSFVLLIFVYLLTMPS